MRTMSLSCILPHSHFTRDLLCDSSRYAWSDLYPIIWSWRFIKSACASPNNCIILMLVFVGKESVVVLVCQSHTQRQIISNYIPVSTLVKSSIDESHLELSTVFDECFCRQSIYPVHMREQLDHPSIFVCLFLAPVKETTHVYPTTSPTSFTFFVPRTGRCTHTYSHVGDRKSMHGIIWYLQILCFNLNSIWLIIVIWILQIHAHQNNFSIRKWGKYFRCSHDNVMALVFLF